MKHILLSLALAAALLPLGSSAQDEKMEEIKRLNTSVESLIAAQAALQEKISRLSDELKTLRSETAGADKSSTLQSMQEDMKRLADKIIEVDKKRQADKELILEQFDKIEKFLKTAGSPSRPKTTSPKDGEPAAGREPKTPVSDKGYEYVIKKGDILPNIVKEYNTEFRKSGMKTITSQMVIDANPGLNPSKLRVGQKIFIPQPAS